MEELQEIICPVCATAVTDEIAACPRCETPHHPDCWEYAGGCAIFGCDSRGWLPAKPEEVQELQKQLNGWNWSFRYHWASYVIMTTSLMTSFASGGINGVLQRTSRGIFSRSQLASTATHFSWNQCLHELYLHGWGIFSTSSFLIPSVYYQYRLERKTDHSLSVPHDKVQDVSDRLTMPRTAQVIKYIYTALRIFSSVTLISSMLLFVPFILGAPLPPVFGKGLGVLFFFLFIVRAMLLPRCSKAQWKHDFNTSPRCRIECWHLSKGRMNRRKIVA